ncbi:hypothetical protein B0H11DRAFT_2424694 [Mycena galericulata]|nr:hypothetical protein B0H11DRAFT_2424694 [Mycena galericulata]
MYGRPTSTESWLTKRSQTDREERLENIPLIRYSAARGVGNTEIPAESARRRDAVRRDPPARQVDRAAHPLTAHTVNQEAQSKEESERIEERDGRMRRQGRGLEVERRGDESAATQRVETYETSGTPSYTLHYTRWVGVEEPTPAPGLHKRRVQRVDSVMEHLGERGCARSELLVDRHAERSRGNGAVKGGYEDVNDSIVQQEKSQYGPNDAAGPPMEVALHTYHSVVALRHLIVHDEVHSAHTTLAVHPDEARSERSSKEAARGRSEGRDLSKRLNNTRSTNLVQAPAARGFAIEGKDALLK